MSTYLVKVHFAGQTQSNLNYVLYDTVQIYASGSIASGSTFFEMDVEIQPDEVGDQYYLQFKDSDGNIVRQKISQIDGGIVIVNNVDIYPPVVGRFEKGLASKTNTNAAFKL